MKISLNEPQYKNTENLNARVLIHEKYSTNKTPWHRWVFDLILQNNHTEIMELGCGTGLLWQNNADRIPKLLDLTLTDLSKGMLDAAKTTLKDIQISIAFNNVNIEQIPYDDNFFDCVIANHILYHVENRKKALQEISRVLESNGFFYASTIGINNMLEMKMLVTDFLGNNTYEEILGEIGNSFSLENGKAQLLEVFDKVELHNYCDSLTINEAEPIVNYVLSCNNIKPGMILLDPNKKDDFHCYISEQIQKNGDIKIQKYAGMFVCSK